MLQRISLGFLVIFVSMFLMSMARAVEINIYVEPYVAGAADIVLDVEEKVEAVAVGPLAIVDTPMNYPNPFKPSQQSTTIRYNLNQDSEVKLHIYNMAGQVIHSELIGAGAEGGKTGYNYVTWDGKDDFSRIQGNGAYLYFITSQGSVLGKGEVAIYE